MNYEEDFVNEELVELDIEGRKFKYKPTTGGDENKWVKDIIVIDPATKTTSTDWGMYNKKKLENIKEVPYSKEIIEKIIHIPAEWKDLKIEDRYKLLSKLKPGLFDKLINAIRNIDEPPKELGN